MADIFTVIADATRREILEVLLDSRARRGEASVSEIVEELGVAQPTVSKHLKTLRDAGLVAVREDGQHRYYSIETRPLDEVDDWLMPFVFADEGHAGEGGVGAAAFAAWAGANVASPLRSAAEQARSRVEQVVQDPTQLGTSLGRRAAEAAYDARVRATEVQDRLHEMQHRFEAAKERLRPSKDDGEIKG